MTKKRRKLRDFDLDDLFEAPFDALDAGMEKLDEGLSYLDRKLDDVLEDADVSLDDSMRKLEERMRNLDKRLGNKTYKHKLRFEYRGANVTVNYNSKDDIQIRTDGDVDDGLMKEIRRRIREERRTKKPLDTSRWDSIKDNLAVKPRTRRQAESLDNALYESMELRMRGPWLYLRTWRGERGKPLEIRPDARVSVSVGGMFGRKYTVEVDGKTLYFIKLEELMERYWARGDLDILVESFSEEEKPIILQVLQLLKASGIAETHHEEIEKLLSS